MQETKRFRLAWVAGFALLWIAAIALRLFVLQIVDYHDLTQRAKRQRDRTVEVSPLRGNFYDRNGHTLAVSIEADSIFASPTETPNVETTVALLGPVIHMDAEVLRAHLQKGKSFSWIKRRVDSVEADRVRSLNLRGIYLQKEPQRAYPNGALAAQVLGFVTTDQDGVAGLEPEVGKLVKSRKGRLLVQADARRHLFGRKEDTAPNKW